MGETGRLGEFELMEETGRLTFSLARRGPEREPGA